MKRKVGSRLVFVALVILVLANIDSSQALNKPITKNILEIKLRQIFLKAQLKAESMIARYNQLFPNDKYPERMSPFRLNNCNCNDNHWSSYPTSTPTFSIIPTEPTQNQWTWQPTTTQQPTTSTTKGSVRMLKRKASISYYA